MKFLYKIYSNSDGFTPSQIPNRLIEGEYLELIWKKYIDYLRKGNECWIYFHGPHKFQKGVYVKGRITKIFHNGYRVILRVNKYTTDNPLTDPPTTRRIEEVVSIKYRQVFLWPDKWDYAPECKFSSCVEKLCDSCETWKSLPSIQKADINKLPRLKGNYLKHIPAFWIIPSRCYLNRNHKYPKDSVYKATHIFNAFKNGEKRYSYPLALGMYRALEKENELKFDAIVPIPLSPEKIASKEINRPLLLARELEEFLNCPVKQWLSLDHSISKRVMQSEGWSINSFEKKYYDYLKVKSRVPKNIKILLVDDVSTRGSTLTQAINRLHNSIEDVSIVISTAGQMILKKVVKRKACFY